MPVCCPVDGTRVLQLMRKLQSATRCPSPTHTVDSDRESMSAPFCLVGQGSRNTSLL